MKKFYILGLVFTVIVTLVSKLLVVNNTSNSIYSADTYDKIVEVTADLPVYSLDLESDDYGETLLADKDNIMKKLSGETILNHSEMNILVVRAKNDFTQYSQSFTQNADVKEIISGDSDLIGKEIMIANYFGVFPNDDNQFCFWGTKGRNIMIPGNDYLIFSEKTETSDYETNPIYRILPTTFSCLNISSDYSRVVEKSSNYYKEYVGSEFFVNNENTLEAVLEIKHEIINTFYSRQYNLLQ